MSSIPTSPISPSSRRKPIRLSSFEILQDASPSPYTSGTTNGTAYSRRSSRTSQTSFLQSPITARPSSVISSRPPSFYDRRKSSSRLSIGSNISLGASDNGLGNLADELEDALDDDYELNGSGFLESMAEGGGNSTQSLLNSPYGMNDTHENERHQYAQDANSSQNDIQSQLLQSPTKLISERRLRTGHQRTISRYGGSDIRTGLEDEEDGVPLGLAKRMRDIESVTRLSLNTDDTISEDGGVVKRTTHALKHLGAQTNIEANLSRIINAYVSMATHRTHKTRDISNQARSLLYRHILDLSDEVIDTLLSELENLSASINIAQPENPLLSLQVLASQTLDLTQTLRSLTDALQESRIQANTATRKLKSVKDMVEDICAEQELVETSILLIQAGDWDRRCRERRAASVCREVVLGFGDKWGLEVDDRPWMRKAEGMVL